MTPVRNVIAVKRGGRAEARPFRKITIPAKTAAATATSVHDGRRGHGLAKLANDRRLYRGGRGLDELAELLQLGKDFLAGNPELLGELMDPNL